MAITDLFSASFLFSVAIIVILIGGMFAYVSYRMSEQDHKLSSMVNLVSILAQELHFLKTKINEDNETNDVDNDDNNEVKQINLDTSQLIGGELIDVSDGDDNDDDEEYEDEDEDCDEDDCDDEDVCDNNVKLVISLDEHEDEDDDKNNIKIITITGENSEENDDVKSDTDSVYNEINNLEVNIETDLKEVLEETEPEQKEIINDLKEMINVDIEAEVDYKKMDVGKLRELVVSKGLCEDASKLKKKDLLKMLGVSWN